MFNLLRKLFGIDNQLKTLTQQEVEILSAPRSPLWKKIREEHLKKQPNCMVCGNKNNLNVHHIIPFHVDSSKELEPENLITLCEGETFNCHLFFGHLRHWINHNPDVIKDADAWRNKTQSFLPGQ